MPASSFRTSLDLLRSRRFGTFWCASLLSSIGTWAQQVAQPWLLVSLGASSFVIGLDAFAMSAPVWLLTLPGGILADRADRRRVIAGFQSVQMLCPIAIVVLLIEGGIRPWIIVALSLVVGVTDALSMPSFSSIVPSIVEPRQVPSALALNSTQFNISRVAGPAIAGVLLATAGSLGCFALSALSYVPFIGIALWILPRRAPTDPVGPASSNALDGIRAMFRDPYLRGALLSTFCAGLLCGPLVTFCPVLVLNVLHGTGAEFSFAIAAFGVGGVAGAVALLGVDPARDRRWLCVGFGSAYGVMVAVCGLAPSITWLPLILALAGVSMSVSNTSTNTLLQTTAPGHLRGRTVSIYMLGMRGGLAIGGLLTGALVAHLGIRTTLLVDGGVAVLAQLLIGWAWLRAVPPNPPAPTPDPT